MSVMNKESHYIQIEGVAQTDQGRARSDNEDAVFCLESEGVFGVADGMGGESFGKLASQTIADEIRYIFSSPTEKGTDDLWDRKKASVLAALQSANRILRQLASERLCARIASTVVLVFGEPSGDGRVRWGLFHLGDSRAYLWRKGTLRQLTRDHSLAQAIGVKHESMLPAFLRGRVTRGVGIEDTIDPEFDEITGEPGDILLLCSDGLTRMVSDANIAKIISDRTADPLSGIARKLIAQANAAGGDDNISVALVRVQGPENSNRESTDTYSYGVATDPPVESPHADGDSSLIPPTTVRGWRKALFILLVGGVGIGIVGVLAYRRNQSAAGFPTAVLNSTSRIETVTSSSAVFSSDSETQHPDGVLLAKPPVSSDIVPSFAITTQTLEVVAVTTPIISNDVAQSVVSSAPPAAVSLMPPPISEADKLQIRRDKFDRFKTALKSRIAEVQKNGEWDTFEADLVAVDTEKLFGEFPNEKRIYEKNMAFRRKFGHTSESIGAYQAVYTNALWLAFRKIGMDSDLRRAGLVAPAPILESPAKYMAWLTRLQAEWIEQCQKSIARADEHYALFSPPHLALKAAKLGNLKPKPMSGLTNVCDSIRLYQAQSRALKSWLDREGDTPISLESLAQIPDWNREAGERELDCAWVSLARILSHLKARANSEAGKAPNDALAQKAWNELQALILEVPMSSEINTPETAANWRASTPVADIRRIFEEAARLDKSEETVQP